MRDTEGKRFNSSRRELQRPVHHAVKQKTIFARIDVRNNGAAVRAHKVERGWRDDPDRILKRSQYVKRQAELIGRRSLEYGYAYRRHVVRALAIGDFILQRAFYRCRRLTARPSVSHSRPPLRRHPLEIFFDWLFSSPWMCLLNLGLLGMYDFSQDGVNKNACGFR